MSLGPYTNSWSNGSLIFPSYKQGLLFGLHKSLFQKKLRTLKRYIKVTGKNVIFKELLYDLMRTFSLGIGESYFFLLQHFLLKIERPFKSVYHTFRNPYGINYNNNFMHCSSWIKSIYLINNVWGGGGRFHQEFSLSQIFLRSHFAHISQMVRLVYWLSPKHSKLISNFSPLPLPAWNSVSPLFMQPSQFFEILCSLSVIIPQFSDALFFRTQNSYFLYHSLVPNHTFLCDLMLLSPFLLRMVLPQHLDKRFLSWDTRTPWDFWETGDVMNL